MQVCRRYFKLNVGEEHFRDLETQALAEALKLDEHVLGLGGGAVIREQNRKLIRASAAKVIYLRCDPQELLRRIQSDQLTAKMRPNLTSLGGGIEEIRQVLAGREPIYRELKHMELDVTRMSPNDAVVHIARLL